MFYFNTKKTTQSKTLRLLAFPFFKYSGTLSQLFLYLFIASFLSIPLYLLGFVSMNVAAKITVFFFVCFIIFLQTYSFVESKVKRQETKVKLSDVTSNMEGYNLAEFLSLESCDIVNNAILISKWKNLPQVSSEVLLYSLLQKSQDARTLILRLGIGVRRMEDDLKNYLEEQRGHDKADVLFSESFEKTIQEALNLAGQRARGFIGEKEILIALSKNDEFLKKILVQHDLKDKDLENITLWLDNLEEKIQDSKKFWTRENLLKFGSLGRDFASGFTVTLDQFSINWWKITRSSVFGDIIGHQKEIEEVQTILTKSSFKNALIVGEVGVGRKSIVQAVAKKCYLGQTLPELNDKRVVELDMVSLLARIQDPEILETTIDEILSEAALAGNVILVIDDLDKFVGQDTQKPGTVDISGILAKYLAHPNFLIIAITSYDGLHRKIEQTPSFLEYFRKVEVSEISEIDTIKVLQNLAIEFEQKNKILILYPTIREIVNLTARYFPNVPFPKKAIDVLDEAVSYVRSQREKVLRPSHVIKIISEKSEIPLGKVEFKEKEVLMNLEDLIHQRIVNQQEAVKEISISMRRARAGIGSKKRPMGTFLFLGPTGVGKTETAKALAQIYFGSEEKMIRIDMSEFQAISDIPRLIGSVSPVEQQGLLTTPVRENPFSLVLLDEIEKAHSNILNLFLQVFDEGHITDGQGRKIIFTNTIIICTSNAGAEMIFKSVESGVSINKDELFNLLFAKGIFRPEFVNRFDAAVLFNPLTKDNLTDIAQLMLGSLGKSLKEKDIDFVVTQKLKDKIVNLSYKPQFGAREMRRVIQDKVENNVAEALLSETITKGDKIEIDSESFKIVKV